MYGPQVLSSGTTFGGGVAAIAVLPETGVSPIFTYAAYAAIVIGGTALILQGAALIYRFSSRSK